MAKVNKELMVTEKGMNLIAAIREQGNADLVAADYAEILGVDVKSINGTFTSLQKRAIGERVESTIEVDEKPKTVKFLKLTDFGLSADFQVK